MGANSCQWCLVIGPWVSGHKLEQRTFHLNMRKSFFPVMVTEHCNRLPREVVETHSLERSKAHLVMILCNCFSSRVGPDNLQRSFLIPAFL